MKHRKFKLNETELGAIETREGETRDALELRRLQGVRMYGSGMRMQVISQVTGAARRTVADWVKAYEQRGLAGLKPGWKGGNHRKLSQAQREEFRQRVQEWRPEQVLSEPGVGEFWSIDTVRSAITQWYGVRYQSRESYRSLLKEAGFSFQQPEGIYRSRPSEATIADFEADAEKK
jgi:transposase